MSRKLGFAAVIVGLLIGGASLAKADTITIQDAQVGQPQAASGIFTYTISLDAAANVQNNDGFVIYDFSGETSYTISSNPGFTLASQPLTGAGSLNNAFPGSLVIAGANATEDVNVPNLVFLYSGATFLGAHSYTLTVDTTDVALPTSTSFGVGIDHSGPFHNSGSIESLTVPNFGSVPLPQSLPGGLAMFALLGGYRFLKNQTANA